MQRVFADESIRRERVFQASDDGFDDSLGVLGASDRDSNYASLLGGVIVSAREHGVADDDHLFQGDAEDVAQETFLKLYRTGSWERMEDERAFLARTAWRLAVSRSKKRREPASNETCDEAANPERSAIAADLHDAVQRMIDALPHDLRIPLALSAIEELSSARIAEMMDIPEGTVRTRIMRARDLLRKKLEAL